MRSHIEEYGLIKALEVNVEGVTGKRIFVAPRSDKCLHPSPVLDAEQHRIFRIGGFLVAEIHPSMEPDVDPARHDPEGNVRRHHPAVRKRNATRFNSLETELTGVFVAG